MRAAVYVRVSTEKQAEKGFPLEDQIERGTQKAKELGASEAVVFADEGHSEADPLTPLQQQLLHEVREGKFQLVICLAEDRRVGNLADQLAFASEVEKYARLEFVSCYKENPSLPGDRVASQEEYEEYLKSEKWQEFRKAVIEHYGYQCVLCGEKKGLEVHHLHYETLGCECVDDVVVLCRDCHVRVHSEGIGFVMGVSWCPECIFYGTPRCKGQPYWCMKGHVGCIYGIKVVYGICPRCGAEIEEPYESLCSWCLDQIREE
ncbi:Resolvase, N terminal domain [Thermanaeromonas toyohensis ToBE]|uniref:Resolvase, N terminal domain n=1 Tax=Thermanaeromonas toyohensis ToBE TaxID=698762 RepID=A0A1W1VTU7_9FIRM|nr:recombinase family protein [Thermanaeromonas toyohensis]SMB96314.1 Resolvase, N terminal domain [Thermanaeromonas toyohensis ToBE]